MSLKKIGENRYIDKRVFIDPKNQSGTLNQLNVVDLIQQLNLWSSQGLITGVSGIKNINNLNNFNQFLDFNILNSINSPQIISSIDTHDFQFPMATTTGVTAGLIDYTTINNLVTGLYTVSTDISFLAADITSLQQNSHIPATINGALANGLTIVNQAIGIELANSTTNGALSFTDWNTFNNKLGTSNTGALTGAGFTITNGSNAVIGTGTTIAINDSSIANVKLINNSISINGNAVVLGGNINGIALTSVGLQQFAATTSAQLAGVISDETGSGLVVFNNTPTFITPILGVASATSINVNGTAGNGFVTLVSQSSAPSTPVSSIRLYADSSNRLSWVGTNGFTRTFDATSLTGNRVYNLPNFDGNFLVTGGTNSISTSTIIESTSTTNVTTLRANAGDLRINAIGTGGIVRLQVASNDAITLSPNGVSNDGTGSSTAGRITLTKDLIITGNGALSIADTISGVSGCIRLAAGSDKLVVIGGIVSAPCISARINSSLGSAPQIGFFGTLPISKITTGIASSTFVTNSGTAVNNSSTFGGYTIAQIAQALINYGLLT
jgi:hypothetical protein